MIESIIKVRRTTSSDVDAIVGMIQVVNYP